MIFSSLNFLFLFLPVVLTAYYLAPGRLKNAVLLLASLFFYGWGEPVYILLMLLSVGFNYFVGLDIAGSRRGTRLRTYYLVLAVCVNLLLLFFFKYLGFALSILHLKGVQIALPIGISFYTFQALSYVIDVYRGRVSAQKNPLDFALYITMFPQLIAGPIVQYIDMEKQLRTRTMSWSRFGIGAEYFTKGLAKKVRTGACVRRGSVRLPTPCRSILISADILIWRSVLDTCLALSFQRILTIRICPDR